MLRIRCRDKDGLNEGGSTASFPELVNNINIFQRATTKIGKIDFRASLTLFIHRLFASKRSALPKGDSPTENTLIRVVLQLELPSDHIVMTYLNTTSVSHLPRYKTCWKGAVQFSICDSCILFKNRASDVECGFIVAIVWYSTQQCKLIIHSVNIDLHDSVTVNKKRLVNPFIFWGQLSCPPVLMTNGIQDIIVKLAHRTEKSIIHFFQYPNTVEST